MFAGRRIAALTGIMAADWGTLRGRFPELPPGAGPRAATRRILLARLAARRLTTGRWPARLEGEPPRSEPAVYVTAHLGSLQGLRYTLRAMGVAAATVLGPHNLERREAERQDRIFDRAHPLGFPHVFEASRAHRLRSALRTGSLILAADLPSSGRVAVPLLGGLCRVDPRPFRLAGAARVPCRAAFLALPRGRWTLTLGPELPARDEAAIESFGRLLAQIAARSPLDLDGVVYLGLARG